MFSALFQPRTISLFSISKPPCRLNLVEWEFGMKKILKKSTTLKNNKEKFEKYTNNLSL